MNALTLALCWSFCWAVAFCDCVVTWSYRETFVEWELNPAMRALGPDAAVAFRVVTLLVATALVPLARARVRVFCTVLVTAVHFALLLWLLRIIA